MTRRASTDARRITLTWRISRYYTIETELRVISAVAITNDLYVNSPALSNGKYKLGVTYQAVPFSDWLEWCLYLFTWHGA